jgi:hypothetical protein
VPGEYSLLPFVRALADAAKRENFSQEAIAGLSLVTYSSYIAGALYIALRICNEIRNSEKTRYDTRAAIGALFLVCALLIFAYATGFNINSPVLISPRLGPW